MVTKQIAVTMSYVALEYICSFKRYNLSVSETQQKARSLSTLIAVTVNREHC